MLKAGHIPAGMELFTSGSLSQLEVVKEWIRASDIYLLILGGRYGSIEPNSGRSYTELEFEYALELGKPFFSIVVSEIGLKTKTADLGPSAVERVNGLKYQDFVNKVTSRLCAFFDGPKDIKLAIFETMPQLAATEGLVGWIPGNATVSNPEVTNELTRALQENRELKAENDKLRERLNRIAGTTPSLDDLSAALAKQPVLVPKEFAVTGEEFTSNMHDMMVACGDLLAMGVSNSSSASELEEFVYKEIATNLLTFGLTEPGKVPSNVNWQRIQLSREGKRLITTARLLGPEPIVKRVNF